MTGTGVAANDYIPNPVIVTVNGIRITQQQINDNFHRYITASDYAVYISAAIVLLFTLTARAFWC